MNKKITTSLVTSLLLATNIYSAQTINLNEITVTSATKSTQSIKDVTSNVEVITKEEIEERNFSGVSEALNTLAGVNITSNGGVGQLDSLFIRGIDTKRIIVLVDGIRYNEPAGASGAPLSLLLIDDIEQIEVVKGAQSGIWGADASGGVVNIITTTAKNGFHGNALIEAGSFNTRKYSTTLSNRTDLGYIKVNATRNASKGFSAFEAKESSSNYGKRGTELGYDRDGYNNNTYSVQAGLNLSDNDELNFSYKKINDKYDYDNSTSDNLTNKSDLNHFFKSANYIHNADNYNIKLNVQQSKFDRVQGTYVAKSLVNEFGIQSNINYSNDGFLVIGANKQNFEHITDELKYQTSGVFLSNTNTFGKLLLTQALRYDNNNAFDEKVTGKLGVKYNFTKDLSTSANYGTAYNAPTLSNLSGTSTLEPESSKSLDLNIEYKNLKLTYFENKIKNMIEYISGTWPAEYENLEGESTFKGYEVTYKQNLGEDILVSLNYTHLSAEDNKGKDFGKRAKDELGFGIDYYGIDKLHINVNGNYIGDRFQYKYGTYDVVAHTGNYTVWNSVVNYKINKTFSTYLKVDNVFNKYYQTTDGYATAERSAYVGLKATF